MQSIDDALKQQAVKTPFKNLKIMVSKYDGIGALGAALYAAAQINEK